MNKNLTYISLFSGGGVGCYGFKEEGFDCIVTNEYLEKRLNIQKINNKCEFDTGYILGDITDPAITEELFREIERYKIIKKIEDIDVVIATPPCQGMSVANHKKDNGDIYRNSLVVEAIRIVDQIKPKFFIFENVQAFLNTSCYEKGEKIKIKDSINNNLSKDYVYHSEVLNLKNYGSNSSRTRTLVIGVRKDIAENISPILLFPSFQEDKTLKEVIGHLPKLQKMGEICETDIYHNFKPYREDMRKWIENLDEGRSAFENNEIERIPHRVIDGKIVINQNKNGDKYKRQSWSKVGPCIHTRNDILSSQNTIHPNDDRVFSIRELMLLMTVPKTFKWSTVDESELNNLNSKKKSKFLKENEMNIRQCIGESVPTAVMRKIAFNIRKELQTKNIKKKDILSLIEEKKLYNSYNLEMFINNEFNNYKMYDLFKIAELSNINRTNNSAYYTDINTLNQIYKELPDIEKDTVRILEPSVGSGNFIPFILKKYEDKNIVLDLCDINGESLEICKLIINKYGKLKNVKINYINGDFLKTKFNCHYDLVIGNPPFSKLTKKLGLKEYRKIFNFDKADNLSIFFLEKALLLSQYVVMIMPKYFLHNESFSEIRSNVESRGLDKIIDFGEKGFDGVLIETIALFIDTVSIKNNIKVKSVTHRTEEYVPKNKIIDKEFPNWIIYRNKFFDEMADKLEFGIFKVFRDRQITKKILNSKSGIRVIKSRNIKQDGSGIININEYDEYITEDNAKNLQVYKNYYDRDDVYMVPNMTYYPRMIKKPKNCIVNGSVAILELKCDKINITEKDMMFISTDRYREFYSIARNRSTRSLNIDNNSVFYFGKMKGE